MGIPVDPNAFFIAFLLIVLIFTIIRDIGLFLFLYLLPYGPLLPQIISDIVANKRLDLAKLNYMSYYDSLLLSGDPKAVAMGLAMLCYVTVILWLTIVRVWKHVNAFTALLISNLLVFVFSGGLEGARTYAASKIPALSPVLLSPVRYVVVVVALIFLTLIIQWKLRGWEAT